MDYMDWMPMNDCRILIGVLKTADDHDGYFKENGPHSLNMDAASAA